MSAFPNLSNIEPIVAQSIKSKANASFYNSGKLPWFRLITLDGPPEHSGGGRGLIIDSLTGEGSFTTKYGTSVTSGIVGYTNKFKPVTAGTISSNADGDTSIENRGYRPSPTIENVKIENGTEGLTRKVSFTIKCYTLAQAEIVGRHYLDPGSYVLLEFGWNVQKSLNQRAGNSQEITTCDLVHYSNLAVLKDKRAASEGTYDAILAVITGGGMTYGDDESYNIEVKLTSQGELPAYLRNQSGNIVSVDQAVSGIKFTQGELDEVEDEENFNVGRFLFMQMYNQLPLTKQIGAIKELSGYSTQLKKTGDDTTIASSGFNKEPGLDSRGLPWTHPSNFINMDSEIREDLVESIKDVKVRSKGEDTLKVPEDVPLCSNESFIRFELAFKILQTVDISGKKVDTGCKPYVLKNGEKINITKIRDIFIDETLCRAHRHIFSTDKSKLYIPNTNLPDFQLTDFLKNTEAATGSLDPYVQAPLGSGKQPKTINGHPKGDGSEDENVFAFPGTTDAVLSDWYDKTIVTETPIAYNYGYLKDLYINFNFFLDVLQRPGLLLHECLMELLNGMSSAVNLYWDFQLYEVGDRTTGNTILKVVDKTFGGLSRKTLKKDEKGVPKVIETSFQSRGINSPFLNAEMDISIAGDMMNQVMMQKERPLEDSEGNKDHNLAGVSSLESRAQNMKTGIFSYHLDPVQKKLSKISNQATANETEVNEQRSKASSKQESEDANLYQKAKSYLNLKLINAKITWDKTINGGDGKKKRETRKQNFKYLIERAGVFPKINNRNEDYDVADEWYDSWILLTSGNDANLEDILYIGTWKDPYILKKYELYDDCLNATTDSGEDVHDMNPVLVPIKFNFTIHGISGLKVGDCFTITDLPKKYSGKIFQIIHVEHEISDLWTTTVEAQMRNV